MCFFFLIIYRFNRARGDKSVDLIDPCTLTPRIDEQNQKVNAWTQGSSCVFDYTLLLRDRQAEMFKLSGNQSAARCETQTRGREGGLGTKMGS